MSQTADSEDREFARRARQGSMTDFEALVSRYESRVFSFARMQCRCTADAQEITQDTFVKAWQAIESWNDAMPFRGWLFTIARRKCIDHYRRSRMPTEEIRDDVADERSPADLIARHEEGQALWALAHRVLSAAQFQCLWLRYAEDMDIEEIARVLGKSRTHVKVLLFRGRLTLTRHSKPQGLPEAAEITIKPIGAAGPAATCS